MGAVGSERLLGSGAGDTYDAGDGSWIWGEVTVEQVRDRVDGVIRASIDKYIRTPDEGPVDEFSSWMVRNIEVDEEGPVITDAVRIAVLMMVVYRSELRQNGSIPRIRRILELIDMLKLELEAEVV